MESISTQHSVIDNYYLKLANKLDSQFYQRMVENENELQINRNNTKVNQELCNQYKRAIESFAGVSNEKVEFFTHRLNQIIIEKPNEVKQGKQASKWKNYFKKKREQASHLMIFLQIETTKSNVNEKIEEFDQSINDVTAMLNESFMNSDSIIEKAKRKKKFRRCSISSIVQFRQSLPLANNKIEGFINEFLKKFHYAYLHSKIFETPIELINEIMDDIYEHKIAKYFYYQEQIKQFQILLNAEEGGQHEEEVEFIVQDLQNERAQYLQKLDTTLCKLEKDINTKCIETNIESDILLHKYKNELLNNLAQIFKN